MNSIKGSISSAVTGFVVIVAVLAAACASAEEPIVVAVKPGEGLYRLETEKKAPERAKEAAVTGNASIAFLNRCIFRGYEIGKSGLVMQPTVHLNFKGFGFTYWANLDTNQRNTTSATFAHEGKTGYNETDLILNYTASFNKLSLTGGFVLYSFRYAEDTEEVFLTGSYDILTKPTLSIYQDVNSYPATYLNLSFSHSLPVYKRTTLDLGASFGYLAGEGGFWRTYQRSTGAYTGPRYSNFHDGMVKAALNVEITRTFTVQPVVQYYFPLSPNAGGTMGRDRNGDRIAYNHNGYVGHNLVYGVSFAYSF